ncbi:hypothetical protein DFJ73DRAFT_18432 [Zopfochytrium polystomum]|nr:hypothetical protein DFJ73DRAFT_18432 [Zopfochytrium polystomum]
MRTGRRDRQQVIVSFKSVVACREDNKVEEGRELTKHRQGEGEQQQARRGRNRNYTSRRRKKKASKQTNSGDSGSPEKKKQRLPKAKARAEPWNDGLAGDRRAEPCSGGGQRPLCKSHRPKNNGRTSDEPTRTKNKTQVLRCATNRRLFETLASLQTNTQSNATNRKKRSKRERERKSREETGSQKQCRRSSEQIRLGSFETHKRHAPKFREGL